MLLDGLSTGVAIFCVFTVVFAALATWYVIRLAHFCRESALYVRDSNAKSLGLRRMAEVESTLTELTDSYEALLQSHKKLRSRIGMRNLRKEPEESTNLSSDAAKTAKKVELRSIAKKSGLLR